MAWTDILGSILKPVGDYFTRRQELKAQDRQQQAAIQAATVERQVELIKQGLTGDMQWEIEQIKNSGWKDEYVLVLLSIPMIGVFIPRVQDAILVGFKYLEQCPEWYRWLILVIFCAIYGIRVWRRQPDT